MAHAVCILAKQDYTRARKCTRPRIGAPTRLYTRHKSVTLIAFPLQQWLLKRASLLRYTHIACPVFVFSSAYPVFVLCQ
jgi:hypothetical protein